MTRPELLRYIVTGSLVAYVFGRLAYEKIVEPYLQDVLVVVFAVLCVVGLGWLVLDAFRYLSSFVLG